MNADGRKAMVGMMPDDDNEQNFLSRWSRRKREVWTEEAENDPSLPVEQAGIEMDAGAEGSDDLAGLATAPGEPDKEVPSAEELEMQANLEAAEAVDLESLEYESDYKLFLKKGVSQTLRNAAMQKLWRSNPVLSVLDGLNDYDEDYGDPKLNVYKSAWNVGRGFLTEAEMNHNPVDRAKTILQKLIEDKPDELAATAIEDETEQEVIEPQDSPGIEMSDEAELPVEKQFDVSEEPKRVSIRNRLFEQAVKDDGTPS